MAITYLKAEQSTNYENSTSKLDFDFFKQGKFSFAEKLENLGYIDLFNVSDKVYLNYFTYSLPILNNLNQKGGEGPNTPQRPRTMSSPSLLP